MKYTIEIGSGVMIHILSFMKTGSSIQKLIAGDTRTHRQQGDLISLFLFFKARRVGYKHMEYTACKFMQFNMSTSDQMDP
jgi:hypothetical protein